MNTDTNTDTNLETKDNTPVNNKFTPNQELFGQGAATAVA